MNPAAEVHPAFRPEQLAVPAELPVAAAVEALIQSLQRNPVTIVCGATGSGKSTQLPKIALRAGRQAIAHTQPRRLAARTLAERIAAEMSCPVGDAVGWQVRFAQAVSERTCVKLMTDGILLSELRQDRLLTQYDTIILDEAHERSLNIDFLLGCLHRLLKQRRDLRLVITSATLDADKFSRHFDGAPVFEVEGRGFPVDIRYRPLDEAPLAEGIAGGIRELWAAGPGDILVFLPGEREIRELREALPRHPQLARYSDAEFLPLYARLPAAQQQRIFHPQRSGRRVVLATNVAETSLTVPGIRYVIDSGLARIARYSPRTQLQSLAIEAIAQDACAQRSGRCGRTAPGIAIRLFGEDDFAARPTETAPEIVRSNLADVVLQMADRRLGRPETFPFVDPPDHRLLRDARRLLQQLQALREDGQLTTTGRQMARLPVEPRYSRMLVEASRLQCLDDAVCVVAALSMPDVRDIGPDAREAARQAHAVWRDPQSDFATLLAMHAAIRAARQELGRSAFERWCREHYLNTRRVREWEDLIHQLQRDVRNAGFSRSNSGAEHLPRALLVGLLDHLGQHHENGEYRGARGSTWRIHPESTLRRSRASWVFAASLVTTQRTLARTVASTDPKQILAAAGPLVRRTPLEPRWDRQRGEAVCLEQCQVFQFVVDASRTVPLARHDPEAARELFLREGLVLCRWGGSPRPAFLEHNQALVKTLQAEEERLRRRDLLCSEEQRVAQYAQALPASVNDRTSLLAWLKEADDAPLRWQREQLLAGPADSLLQAWPTQIKVRGQTLRLRYRFAPGDPDDGVSVELPLEGLAQFRAEDFRGCIPGLVEQQLEVVLRQLPKADRKLLIPLADTIRELQNTVAPGADFQRDLRAALESRLGHPLPLEALDTSTLPERLQLRFVLRAPGRRDLDSGRDLSALQAAHAQVAQSAALAAVDDAALPGGLTRFPEPTPNWLQRSARGTPLRLILQDQNAHVDLQVSSDPRRADAAHADGLRRLAWLRLKPRLTLRLKRLKSLRALKSLPAPASPRWDSLQQDLEQQQPRDLSLGDALTWQALRQLDATLLAATDRSSFETAVDQGWSQVDQTLERMLDALERAEKVWSSLRMRLLVEGPDSPLQHAVALLLSPGFVARTLDWAALPRYLEGLATRLDKRQRNPGLDHDREQQVQTFEARLLDYHSQGPGPERREQLLALYWALQDWRMAQFAQELGVPHPVSPKRLNTLFLALTRPL